MYDLATQCLSRTKDKIKSTFNDDTVNDFGTFGGMFALDTAKYKNPILVSSIDGVGTKIKLAITAESHYGIGVDLVNHSINDILVHGAKPLFFLDYFSTAKIHTSVFEEVMSGMVDACRKVNCPIIGGEFAVMKGFYEPKDYDIAGCIVGVVEKENLITGKNIEEGDVLIGLSSMGLHTNGFSYVSSVILNQYNHNHVFPELGKPLIDELLIPHQCYYDLVSHLCESFGIYGIAHITGGGLVENIRRVVPQGLGFQIEWGSWKENPIFRVIYHYGKPQPTIQTMRDTFNLGIGMVLVVREAQSKEIYNWIHNYWAEGTPFIIGKVVMQS